MRKRKSLIAFVVLAAVVFGSCTAEKTSEDLKVRLTKKSEITLGAEITEDIPEIVAQKGKYTLSVDPFTLNLKVTDTSSGKSWASNPEDPDSDTVANVDNVDMMRAQFYLEYYDSKGSKEQVNSYTDCVSKEQFKVYQIPDGIAVAYQVGEPARSEDDIIHKISGDRFEAKVLSKLSDEEREILEGYYRFYEEENLWVVKSSGKSNFEEILSLMDKAGYTTDDLEQDNIQNGITTDRSAKPSFDITVFYYLTENGLCVEIPTNMIEHTEGFYPHTITLLETFGAVNGKDETAQNGFILIPDGSGALMEVTSELDPSDYYSQPIYGNEQIVRSSSTKSKTENIAIPAFGLSDGSKGYIASVSDGAASASIEAYRGGRNNDLFAAYTVFQVYQMDFVRLSGDTVDSSVPVFQSELYAGSYKVDYLLLSSCSGYADMALAYRNFLKSNGTLSDSSVSDELPLYLETLCGVYGYKSFLGISYTDVKAATTFEQNIDILAQLKKEGISNIQLKTIGWFNNGIKHDYPSMIKPDGELGGTSGLKSLMEYCIENSIGLYPDVDLLTTYMGNNGFSKAGDSAKTMDIQLAQIEDISYATLYGRDTSSVKPTSRYVISPSVVSQLTDRFLNKFKKFSGLGLSMRTIGSELYSDYNENSTFDRTSAQLVAAEQLKKAKSTVSGIMVNTGHQYASTYADHIVRVACDDSRFLCEDRSVPFYQMVFRDTVNLGSRPINLSDDFTDELLRCAEYGVAPNFQVCYESGSILNNTEYDANYAAGFNGWKEQIVSAYRELSGVLNSVQGQQLISNDEVAESIFCSTYQNGVKIYVNYTRQNAEINGVTIPAKSFAKGER